MKWSTPASQSPAADGVHRAVHTDSSHEGAGRPDVSDTLAANLRGANTKLAALMRSQIPLEIAYELSVPERASIGRTGGNGIAYNCLGDNDEGREVRNVFDRLASELEQRMLR